jgi:plasmid stability protein
MGSLLIRNLDDRLKARLRVRAAEQGRSMEEEARRILRRELGEPEVSDDGKSLAEIARELFGPRGADLEPHPRVPVREPPDFSK